GWGGAPQWGYPVPTAPQPGVIPLRPLDLGEILGGAFATMRAHWKQLAGVMLAVMAIVLPAMGLAVGIGVASVFEHFEPVFDPPFGEEPPADDVAPLLVAGGVLFVVLMALGLFGMAVVTALCPAVLKEAVTGRPTTFRTMWRAAVRRTPAVAGAVLLAGLIAGLPMLAALAVGIAVVVASAAADSGPAVLGLIPVLMLAALPVTLWLTTRFGLASAVVVLEDAGPVTALRRSAALVRGAWWRIFGITLLGGLIAGAIGWVMQLPFNFVGTFALLPAMTAMPEDGGGPSGGVITAMVFALFLVFFGAAAGQMFQIGFTQLVSSLLYVDQRMRREGLAEAILAELAVAPFATPSPAQPPAPSAPPQAGGPAEGQ
ncbi:hypothetical protein, partial [Streptomyces sp. BR123]|uniref:DUF7847 domain-containing protein n=1 Tax=Streptomyces sp. BR123 TaxID=2749828 RepID=UPI001C4F9FDF